MVDHSRLTEALTAFARSMSEPYDISDVLYRLSDQATEVLGLAGAGIALAGDDRLLRYATATSEPVARLEQVQEDDQEGPCYAAFTSQQLVVVEDVGTRTDWPSYREEAMALGLTSVAGIPQGLGQERLGALNLYGPSGWSWSQADLTAAQLLADMAAGYLIHAALVRTRELADQLQLALDKRVLIEQAKGMLAEREGLPVAEAFERLRSHARSQNQKLYEVARAVVEEGLRPGS